MQNRNLGAAALAAAFVILHDTVGSGPTFRKGQTVPAEELAFLGLERLLEAGAIRPVEEAAPEPEAPTSAGMDLSELAAEAADRGYVLALPEEHAALQAETESLRKQLEAAASEQERLSARIQSLEAAQTDYERQIAELQGEAGALRTALERTAEKAELADEEPAPADPAPAKSTRAKKGE